MNKYRFVGIEENEMTCELCKKQHIEKAFVFMNCETGSFERFGSSCAKKAMGFSSKAAMGKSLRIDIEKTFEEKCWSSRKNGTFLQNVDKHSEDRQRALDKLYAVGL